MNKIYFNDITTAQIDNNFDSLLRKMDKGVAHEDMMMVLTDLTDYTYALMEDVFYEVDDYEVEEAYSNAIKVINDRADKLDAMPDDTVMTKDEVMTIVENLADSIRFM